MDECTDALSAFSKSLQKLLNQGTASNLESLQEQLTGLSEQISTKRAEESNELVLTESIGSIQDTGNSTKLVKSFKHSSVEVLTNSNQQYGGDSQGVMGVFHRPVLRVSSKSAVNDPHVSERYAQLVYLSKHSSSVTISIPKQDLVCKSSIERLFESSSPTQYNDQQPSSSLSTVSCYSLPGNGRLPIRNLQIALTKLDVSTCPHPTRPHPPDGDTGDDMVRSSFIISESDIDLLSGEEMDLITTLSPSHDNSNSVSDQASGENDTLAKNEKESVSNLSVSDSINENEIQSSWAQNGNESLKCANKSQNEPLESNESGNEPLEDANESGNESLVSGESRNEPLEDANESGNESLVSGESGNEPLEDANESGNESLVSGESRNEPLEDANESGNEPLEDTNESGNEPLEDANESGNEPLEDANEYGNEPLEDVNKSGNESLISGESRNESLISGESRNEPLEDADDSGNELLEDANESGNESLVSSESGNEPLEDANESGNELLEDANESGNELLEDANESGNELLEDANESGNEPLECVDKSQNEPLEMDESGNESLKCAGNELLECENENQSVTENVLDDKNETETGNGSQVHTRQGERSEDDEDNGFWSVVKEDITVSNDRQRTHLPFKYSSPTKPSTSRGMFPLMYTCCGCNKTIYTSVDMICYNERLDLIVCQICFKSLIKGSFIVENGHEIYCTVCGEGGSIILCDTCKKSVCQGCLIRFLGQEELKQIIDDEDQTWSCFSCDPRPIRKYQIICQQHRELKKEEEMKGRKRSSRALDETPLPNTRRKRLKSKKVFHNKLVNSSDSESKSCVIIEVGRATDSNNEICIKTKDDYDKKPGSGRGLKGGAIISEQFNRGRRMLDSTSSSNSNKTIDGCGQVGGDIQTDTDNAASDDELSSDRNASPLSLLSELLSADIDSSDISLSDIDQILTSDLDCISESNKCTTKKRLQYNNNNSDCTGSTTGSTTGSLSSVSSTVEEKPKKRFSLRSKKSWRLNQTDYGIEKRDRLSNQFGSEGEESLKSSSRNIKKKPSSISTKSSDRLRGDYEYSYDNKRKATSKDDEKITVKRRKKEKKMFSSDEDDDGCNDKWCSLLTSSDDDIVLNDREQQKPANQEMKPISFHLACASSDESAENVFSPKKKKPRIRLDTSSESDAKSKQISIIIDSSSDDFEDRKKFRSQPIISSIKKRRRKQQKNRFFSDQSSNDTDSDSSTIRVKEEADSSDSDDKTLTPSKRRNIRKLISFNKLTDMTKEAQKIEKERLERLKKRTKNQSGDDREEERAHIILEESKDTTVQVRHDLVPKILPHQIKGIKFLYNSCCEDLERLNNDPGSGAILAHCMGLGKTLQIIAFIDALLLRNSVTGVNKVLVLSPVNTLLNWLDEWNKWIPTSQRKYRVIALDEKTNYARINHLRRWFQTGGVTIMGFTMFANLSLTKNLKKKRDIDDVKKYLLEPGPDIIICDEGHVLRQKKSQLSIAVNNVRTQRRIVLTGTPLQNNLLEYYTMVSFVKPNLLGTPKEFCNRFENPIKNGQHSDSVPHDVRIMKQRAHVLHELLKGCVDRRDYRILAESLPPKHEYVVSIRMSPVQNQLIVRYLEKNSGYHTASDLFSTFANLLKVWNHPRVLQLDQEKKQDKFERQQLDDFVDDDDGSLDGFIVHSNEESSSDVEIIGEEKGGVTTQIGTNGVGVAGQASTRSSLSPAAPSPVTTTWYQDVIPKDCAESIELSGKMMFLLELIKEVEKVGERILVFSQSLLVLDMIEEMLQLPESDNMIEGIHYFRLDGSTKVGDRRALMNKFNKKQNNSSSRLRVFLISTKAGSLGINLIGANRVVIFDACWNPTHDLQSIFRTYRFGQTKPVFVYRLLAKGTMEEKIYDRQVTKQSLSMRVVDEKQIGRHYSFAQLQELFVYTPPTDTPPVKPCDNPESDMIFCNILEKLCPKFIVGYHTHDSLLEHNFDEELSKEEQKIAWDNYNNQKEMDSRAYNMSLQMRQNVLQDGTNVLSAATAGGLGVSLPGSSGTGMSPKLANLPASQGATQFTNIVRGGLTLANQVKSLLLQRNGLKDVALRPNEVAARQQYILCCFHLEKYTKQLHSATTQLSDMFRSPMLRSSLSDNLLNQLDSSKEQFLNELRVIDKLSRVQIPQHNELLRIHSTTGNGPSGSNYRNPLL